MVAPSLIVSMTFDVLDLHRIDLERVLTQDDEVGEFADCKGALAVLLVILFGRPFGHGFEPFEGCHTLVGTDCGTATGDAVHSGGKHHHLVERSDDKVGVITRAETGIDGVAHGREIHCLFLAAVCDVRFCEVEGVEGVERGANLVFDELGNVILAHELPCGSS